MLEDDGMPVADFPDDDGAGAPRQSYNFAPGYHGIVYRADTPDWGAGAGPRSVAAAGDEPEESSDKPDSADAPPSGDVKYKLQSMKWGLIPFWTKRNPDYASMMRTINCREDSLSTPGGMWTTMKARKRCIVIAQGFFEWLKTGPKDKLPHFVKRKDGRLMCFAGLWDCVQYEGKVTCSSETKPPPRRSVACSPQYQAPRKRRTPTPSSPPTPTSSSSSSTTACPLSSTPAPTRSRRGSTPASTNGAASCRRCSGPLTANWRCTP